MTFKENLINKIVNAHIEANVPIPRTCKECTFSYITYGGYDQELEYCVLAENENCPLQEEMLNRLRPTTPF